MAGIGFGDIKRAATQATDGDKKLRLGRSDGQVKTAKHGFGSRLVRWFAGATKRDREDNKQLLGNLLSGLKQKYGDTIGTQAFLAARPLAYVDQESGDIMGATARSLSAQQVKDAIAFAEAAPNHQARQDALAQADAFKPGSANFGDVANQAGVAPDTLSDAQKNYFQSRLRERVVSMAQEHGEQPKGSEVARVAKKLLRHTANTVGAEADRIDAAHNTASESAGEALKALGDEKSDPAAALVSFISATDAIVEDTAMKQDFGAEDTHNARSNALDNAVSQLSTLEARSLYDRLVAPNGPGRKVLLAANLASYNISALQTPYKAAASADIVQSAKQVIIALAVRAGVDKSEIDNLAGAIENDRMRGPKDQGVPKSVLQAAGVTDVSDVLDTARQFDKAMAARGQVIKQRHQSNN